MSALREMRMAVGISAYELAKRAGISASRLSYLERGIETPSKDEINRLASAFYQCSEEAKERLRTVFGESNAEASASHGNIVRGPTFEVTSSRTRMAQDEDEFDECRPQT